MVLDLAASGNGAKLEERRMRFYVFMLALVRNLGRLERSTGFPT